MIVHCPKCNQEHDIAETTEEKYICPECKCPLDISEKTTVYKAPLLAEIINISGTIILILSFVLLFSGRKGEAIILFLSALITSMIMFAIATILNNTAKTAFYIEKIANKSRQ